MHHPAQKTSLVRIVCQGIESPLIEFRETLVDDGSGRISTDFALIDHPSCEIEHGHGPADRASVELLDCHCEQLLESTQKFLGIFCQFDHLAHRAGGSRRRLCSLDRFVVRWRPVWKALAQQIEDSRTEAGDAEVFQKPQLVFELF